MKSLLNGEIWKVKRIEKIIVNYKILESIKKLINEFIEFIWYHLLEMLIT